MRLMVMKVGPVLIIAKETEIPSNYSNPRILQVKPAEDRIEVVLHKMVGEPDNICINNPEYSYEATEKNLAKFYTQEVSPIQGLNLV